MHVKLEMRGRKPGYRFTSALHTMLRDQVSHEKAIETKKPLATLWNNLLASQGVIAYLPIIVVTILMFVGASWQFFWLHTDAARYQCYALTFWLGGSAVHYLPTIQCSFLQVSTAAQPPFHMLPLEYPPLTLAVFSLALLAPLAHYQLGYVDSQMGDLPGAEQEFRLAVHAAPGYTRAWISLAATLGMESKMTEARQTAAHALELAARNPEALALQKELAQAAPHP